MISPAASALGGVNAVAFRDISGANLGPRGYIDFISGAGTHLGNDVYTGTANNWVCGGIIYAPGYGTIEDIAYDTGSPKGFGNAIMIRHAGAGRGGRDILSVVLHMQERSSLSIGERVTPITILGHIGHTGGSGGDCHAHIELRYFSTWTYYEYGNIYAQWKDTKLPRDVTNDIPPREQWENPDTYTLNLIPMSYFDGAGSLIDPANGGNCGAIGNYGCSTDKVRLHSHSISSTGVFQVVSQKDRCEYVRIEGLSSAIIAVKRWDETYPRNSDGLSTIYRVNSLPASLRLPVDKWVMISVTTTQQIPVGETRDITLRCLTASEYSHPVPGQISDIAPPIADRALYPDLLLVKFGDDFHWSGSGSLVTFSGSQLQVPNTYDGFGRNKDMAIKFSSRKSLLSFQIFSDGINCRSVRISSATGASTGTLVNASIKEWTSKYWGPAIVTTLPFNFSIPSGRAYWILKLKPATIGTDNIRIDCI